MTVFLGSMHKWLVLFGSFVLGGVGIPNDFSFKECSKVILRHALLTSDSSEPSFIEQNYIFLDVCNFAFK